MRQKCTQPVTPSATQTCTRALAQHHDERDQQQQARHRGQHRHQRRTRRRRCGGRSSRPITPNSSAIGMTTRLVKRADQQRHAHALQRAVDHVAAENVGAEQVRARIAQRLAAVEGHAGQRRRVARFLEGLRLEDAVDDGARLEGGHVVAVARAADPGDGIQQRDEHEQADHDDAQRAAAARARVALSRQKRSAGRCPRKPDRAGDQQDHDDVGDPGQVSLLAQAHARIGERVADVGEDLAQR